ncbi:MAG: RHS repeat-associated core domain-containing protein [Acidobacteriota bacterium]
MPRTPFQRLMRCLAKVLLAAACAVPALAYHPNHPLGFSPEGTYQGLEQLDNVDLFSGKLSVTLPIGPFLLSYNSNVWKYQQVVENGQIEIEARPDRIHLGGLGWHLGFGEVYSPVHALNDTGRWMFVGDDGGRRVFYDQLHRGEDDGASDVLYTRDGSYLRMIRHNAFFLDIEFPDGTTRRYNSWTGGLGAKYRLEKVWSRFASPEDPDALVTYNADYSEWTMTNRYGRTHRVLTSNQYPWLQVVTRLEIGMVGGVAAGYDFEYVPTAIDRSCKDTSSTPPRITVPLLTAIEFPDGSRFEMPSYHTTCAGGIADVSGALRELTLPTGGGLRWAYQEYEFPPGGTNSVFNTSAGVETRSTVQRDGSVEGTWHYRTTDFGAGPSGLPADDPKMVTEVVYPADQGQSTGCSKHFFNARYWQTPSQGRGWEYGLPFDYSQSSGGRFLSSEMWTDSTPGGACTGDRLRSTYLEFRRDATPGSGSDPAADWYNTNRKVEATRTVFHDDGDRWLDVQHDEYDGLGHFRKQVTTGNFHSASANQEKRTFYTNFNRVSGTYPSSGYAPPAPSDPWILGVHDYLRTVETEAFGKTIKRVEVGFEPDTGFLYCTRVRKSDVARRAHDVLTVYSRNGLGQITDAKTYGGDLQSLPTYGGGCGDPLPEPEYWQRHGYASGARISTLPIEPDGTPGPYLTLDVDVDPTTGVVLTSRDASGLGVSFGYDLLGRNDSITPAEGARTEVDFVNASATTGAKVIVQLRDPQTNAVLTRSETWFDDFGRLWRDRHRLPGNVWSERETLYTPRGWVASVSEWADLQKKTSFLDYDPFGRATRIQPPDGSTHDRLVSFQGIRRTTDQVKIAQVGGEAYASRTREYDSHGRLRRVEEPSGVGGSMVATTYDFDVASRLTRLRSGSSSFQERRYDYDNRGFLLSETHPEKGVVGGGTVTYGRRDSRGLVRRMTDGPSDLAFGYDFLGRRTHIWDRNANNRVIVKLDYDDAPGRGAGKLWRATRNQWIDVPWVAGHVEERAQVIETFDYQGRGGAVSRKTTSVDVGGEAINLTQGYTWDSLGLMAEIAWAGQTVENRFDQGLLTEVVGWGTVDYHASGLWHHVDHANGVQDLQMLDADFRRRPGALWALGSSAGAVGTGDMSWDGAGNVKGIGVWSFAYDGVSRLVTSDFGDWQQQFSYDLFGNLTAKTTTPPAAGSPTSLSFPVDPASNRLSGLAYSYDAAGNLTSWGSNLYSWNESGLMEHNRVGGLDWVFLYNAAGERVATLMPSEQPVVRWTERDLGNRLITEYVQVGSLGAPGSTLTTKRYVYAGVRQLASEGPDGIRHYHLDHLGSVRMATDAAGESVFGLSYLPYGEPAGVNDTSEILQFTGHERDHPTGLDYMHARFYTQVMGRFLSVDPLQGQAETPQSLNRYAYVVGNPLRWVDPDGNKGVDVSGFASLGASLAEYIADRTDPGPGRGALLLGASALSGGVATAEVYLGVATFEVSAGSTSLVVVDGLNGMLQAGITYSQATREFWRPVTDRVPWLIHPEDPQYSSPTTLDFSGLFGNAPSSSAESPSVDEISGFFWQITVAGTAPQLPLVPLTAPGVEIPDSLRELAAGASPPPTAVRGSTTICNQQSCFFVGIQGSSREEISSEAFRFATEISLVGGLNELRLGSCMLGACPRGVGGGPMGVEDWTAIYAF